MKTIEYIIEWLGILFLSIEAIKIENFKVLTDKLWKIRISLNSKIWRDEETGVLMEWAAPKGYRWLRRYSYLVTLFIGYFLIFFFLYLFHLAPKIYYLTKSYILIYSGISTLRVVLNIFLLPTIFIILPFFIGNEFIRFFTVFTNYYTKLISELEKNTYKGIIGIIGFILVSISLLLKIIIE